MRNKRMRLFNFYIDESMLKELKRIAYEQDKKLSDLIREAVAVHFNISTVFAPDPKEKKEVKEKEVKEKEVKEKRPNFEKINAEKMANYRKQQAEVKANENSSTL